jgi:hypothetical protein
MDFMHIREDQLVLTFTANQAKHVLCCLQVAFSVHQETVHTMRTTRVRNRMIASFAMVAVFVSFAYPFFTVRKRENLTTKDGPLAPQAKIRGAYLNAGGKDMGADPEAQERKRH